VKFRSLIYILVVLNFLFIIPVHAEYSKESLFPERIYHSPVEISNNYLDIAVEFEESWSLGRFTLGCTGGDPSNQNDDNQILLYGHPLPLTSFTTVRIDENNRIFGSEEGTFSEIPTDYGTYVKGVWTCDNIQVTQVCELVPNPSTGRADAMKIRYQFTNVDQIESHNVGLRILLDTMLGPNDGAPFQVPEVGSEMGIPITTEREFLKSRNEVPDFWQSFDDLNNPTVVSQGTLKGGDATEPDRVIFASWPDFYDTTWEYSITPGKPFGYSGYPDSSVGLYWNEVNLDPQETVEYVTYYGLSDLSQAFGDISLSVTSPIELEVVNGQYSPNPFTIQAYIEHDLSNPSDIDLSIELPEGLELEGSSVTQRIENLGPNDQRSVVWYVRASEQTQNQLFTYTITASAAEMATQSVSRGVTVPSMSSNYDTNFRPDPNGYRFLNTGRDNLAWSQFCDLYGADEIEINGQRLPRAENFYENSYTHTANGGRCFGMASSSLYLCQNSFEGYDIGNNWLDDLPNDDIFPDFLSTIQDWIEYYHPRQLDNVCHEDRGIYNNPQIVYNELKQRMNSGNGWDDPMVIDIWWSWYDTNNQVWRSAGHTVTPTRIVESADHSSATVFIYDNSKSTTQERELIFDLSNWNVRDGSSNPWNGGNVFNRVTAVRLSSIQQEPQMRNYETITSPTGHLFYTDGSGNNLGYYNGEFVSDIQGAYKVEITGAESEFPETYDIGNLDLRREIIGTEDEVASVSIMKPSALIKADISASEGSQDELYVPVDGSSVELISGDSTGFVRLMLDQETNNYARVVMIESQNFEPGETLGLSFTEGLTGVKITNAGNRRELHLYLEQIGFNPGTYDCPFEISVDENSSATIIPESWDDLGQTRILIQIDIGNDGSIDQTQTIDGESGMTVALLAGQTLDVGMVNATYDEANLYIKYTTEDGWTLNETHIAVAGDLEEIPTTKKGDPIPGQFNYSEEHLLGVTEFTYTLPLADLGLGSGDTVFIAAHAAVQKEVVEDDGIILLEEGAWGAGYAFPGRNWATYFSFGIPEETPSISDQTPLET